MSPPSHQFLGVSVSKQFWRDRCLQIFVIPLVLLVAASSARAERPVAPKLLPENTLAMIRVADAQELNTKFRDTALGRMLQDEKIAPLVSQLYGSLQEQ